MLAESGLTFTDESHEYRLDGAVIPGVTQLLSEGGICKLPSVPWSVIERKRRIGRAVHLASEYVDDGTLNWDKLDPAIVGYVRGYAKFLRESMFQVLLSEKQVLITVGDKHCAGRLDRTGMIGRHAWIVDLKTAASALPHWGVQTSGYELGLPPLTIPPYKYHRGALILREDGSYKLHEYKDPADRDVFRALLLHGADHPAVVNWKHNHGIVETEEVYE